MMIQRKKYGGSIPSMALTDSHEVSFIDFLAHLVERPNFNQNVAGSIPAEIVSLTSLFFRFIIWTVGITG